MTKKILITFLLAILVANLFIIQLTKSQENPTPEGIPNPQIPGGEINPETGIPKNIEKAQEIGEKLSDEDERTDYLKREWQKILEKSETFGPAVRLIQKSDPFFNIILGMPIAFSWFFFLTLVIWIAFVVFIFRATALFEITQAWLHWLIAIAIIAIITYYRQPKSIAAFIVGLITILNRTWWIQYVIIAIVILIVILLIFFSKQLEIVGKWIKERNEKNIEQLQKERFKEDVEAADELRKTISK